MDHHRIDVTIESLSLRAQSNAAAELRIISCNHIVYWFFNQWLHFARCSFKQAGRYILCRNKYILIYISAWSSINYINIFFTTLKLTDYLCNIEVLSFLWSYSTFCMANYTTTIIFILVSSLFCVPKHLMCIVPIYICQFFS